jgi:hypothetical protein
VKAGSGHLSAVTGQELLSKPVVEVGFFVFDAMRNGMSIVDLWLRNEAEIG